MEKLLDNLLTISQVAEILQVKESTIRAWVFRKKIPFKKINHIIRFRPEEINGFIDGQ